MAAIEITIKAPAPQINLAKANKEGFLREVPFDNMLVRVFCLTDTANHVTRHLLNPILLDGALRMVAMVLNRGPVEAQRGRNEIAQATYYTLGVPSFNLGDMAITVCIEEETEEPLVIFGRVPEMKEAGLLAPVSGVS